MKNNPRHIRLSRHPARSIKLPLDSGGNPYWGHLAMMLKAWQQRLSHPYVSALDLTLAEIRSIEARVRKELYP